MKKFMLFSMMFASMLTFSKKVTEKIEINNGFYKVPAVYTYDDSKKNQPILVMLHGTASNKDEVDGTYIKLADKLIENGISSIRFDFIGTGDSKVDYIHYTLTTAVSDTEKVIDFARQKTNNKIGLLGWSQGGTIALLSGSNKEISSVATWAGSLTMFNSYKDKYEKAKKDGYIKMEFSWRSPLNLSLQWLNEVKNTDVLEYVKKIDKPILALAGTDDDVVDPKQADEIIKSSSNLKSKVVKIKNANHIFNIFTNDVKVDEVINNTVSWFNETLK